MTLNGRVLGWPNKIHTPSESDLSQKFAITFLPSSLLDRPHFFPLYSAGSELLKTLGDGVFGQRDIGCFSHQKIWAASPETEGGI
ncbi:hypothetical protein L1987_57795 [Smallanthus sonchifolius]|uniref:Uncharacterized protein n=1 Tax=Smallanthus sonchifolius TaxID=185202 RepID=A0ACB9DDK2_9ASTR|nr:hypothetical protein L1987_57795 [Smallanthus sonchifolius]